MVLIFQYFLFISIYSCILFSTTLELTSSNYQANRLDRKSGNFQLLITSRQLEAGSSDDFIIWEENFESGENGWLIDSGWELTTSSFHSENHSVLSADSDANMDATHNLLTPSIPLPELGDDETMHYSFWIYTDIPDKDGDDDDFLEDYYTISVLDLAALAWHSSDHNGDIGDGANFWCADEE